MLRTSARGLLLLSAPAALAACGRTVPKFVDRVGYQLNAGIGEGNVALSELVPLLKARARAREMDPVLNQVAPGRMATMFREQTGLGPYDPQTNSRPPVNRLVVVNAVESAALEPIASAALAHGVKVVAYPRPLRNQTAAIVFDSAAAATALARQAANSARRPAGARRRVLLALPPSECGGENALCAEPGAIEKAWRSALATAAPGLSITTTDEAVGELGGAEELAPLVRGHGFDVVLAWNDEVATGLSRALRRNAPPGVHAQDVFVGALGAPTVASGATIAELQRSGPLRIVIAARLRELAEAMVDLPHALLHGAPARNIALRSWKLTPGSAALHAYGADYAAHPPGATINYEAVPLNPSAFH